MYTYRLVFNGYTIPKREKIYKVTDIDFCILTIEVSETDISVDDIPENEVFPVGELRELIIRLSNGSVMGRIIDFVEWVKQNRRDN